jgi:hypothetical protein
MHEYSYINEMIIILINEVINIRHVVHFDQVWVLLMWTLLLFFSIDSKSLIENLVNMDDTSNDKEEDLVSVDESYEELL